MSASYSRSSAVAFVRPIRKLAAVVSVAAWLDLLVEVTIWRDITHAAHAAHARVEYLPGLAHERTPLGRPLVSAAGAAVLGPLCHASCALVEHRINAHR